MFIFFLWQPFVLIFYALFYSIFRLLRYLRHTKPQMQDEFQTTPQDVEQQFTEVRKSFREAVKILLLGTAESGKTTIIKQMRILHINGYTDE